MKRLCFLLLIFVFSLSIWTLPALASDTSAEIEQLKEEVKRLLKRIEELEKKQAETEAKTVEIEEKTVEAEKKGLQAGYDRGFYIKTQDENFLLRTNLLIQFRYTYLSFDRMVNANNENWSNFLLRRARVFFSGNAPNKDWTYYFHIQLETFREARGAANLHDAYVTWQKYPYFQVRFGRGKIPYGLHFWQSASLLNGVDRSIFSGETDVDNNEDARRWPGGNANFQVSNEDSVTKFPIGGFNLYRSQGIHLQGDINLFGEDGFLQYWAGVYNGRNTKGGVNSDSTPLWLGRISINPFGKYDLSQQGDLYYSKTPKVCFLLSGAQYGDRLSKIRSSADGSEQPVAPYDIKGSGYNLAALIRYRGFSMDAEYGYDRLEQKREGGHTWERFGYRFDTGYFLIPRKFEVVARYAHLERMKDNTVEKSLASGLGLVSVNGGTNNAIEDSLKEYTIGLNYYVLDHNMKLFVDYSYLTREFIPIPTATAPVDDQHDHRFRTMMQFFW
ncbi:MAG: porin [Nitrospirota bacterium]|nr:porin [Nitrospirota bacterium]MDH5767378.1 porin [Nitrospirota bacterium]